MKRSINILIAALTVQAAVYAFLTYRDMSGASSVKPEALLAVNFDKLDKVTVESGEKKSLELVKKDGKWMIPSLFNFPVADEKVQQVLKFLVEAKRNFALGNTKAAAKQYETTDEKFERKFSFYVADKLQTTLYLGNSPTYRKVYARVDNDDKTYSIEFNTIDAPSEAKDWADRSIYKVDRSKVAEVKFQDFTLKKEGTAFALVGLKPEEVTNATEADNFLGKLQNPLFEDVLASGTYNGATNKLLEYTVTNDDKTERHYSFFEMKTAASAAPSKAGDKTPTTPAQSEFAALKVSDLPYFFKVRRARVDELLKFNHASFAKKKEAEKAAPGVGKEAGQLNTPAGSPG